MAKLATKEDLKAFATKDELKAGLEDAKRYTENLIFVTRREIRQVDGKLTSMAADVERIARTPRDSDRAQTPQAIATSRHNKDACAYRIADQRPAWSCAKQNPFSECRRRSCWELPRILRSRMAMTAASVADVPVGRPEGRPLRPSSTEGRPLRLRAAHTESPISGRHGHARSKIRSANAERRSCWELPRILRSRMAMTAASVADAPVGRPAAYGRWRLSSAKEGRPLRLRRLISDTTRCDRLSSPLLAVRGRRRWSSRRSGWDWTADRTSDRW